MNYSKNDVILVSYPFSDLSVTKIRPAIIVNGKHPSQDYFIVPLSSRTKNLLPGEFILQDWQIAGLNVETSVKRGIFTIQESLIIKKIGVLSQGDMETLETTIKQWLDFL